MESSLSAPWDIIPGAPHAQVLTRSLTDEEQVLAVAANTDRVSIEKFPFPKTDRYYTDPTYLNQSYCLISFVPTKNAKPDEHGVFGYMKVRGAFHTIQEANQRAEWLIRNVDSYHTIQTTYMGRPFPVCHNTKKYVQETNVVDIRKKAVDTISEDIRQKKWEEKKEIDDIKEREQRLLDESKDDYVEDPLESYTTLHVKKANLLHMYVYTMKKQQENKEKIKKVFKQIQKIDEETPEYAEKYLEKYDNARKAIDLPTIDNNREDNFLRFLGNEYLNELDFNPFE